MKEKQELVATQRSVAVARARLREQLGYPPETDRPPNAKPLSESITAVLAGLGNATQQEQA